SDANGNAFVSKVDINTLICFDFKKVSENTNKTNATAISPALLNLQSLPGAAGCILLDYDGYYMPAGNVWNNGNPINAAPSGMSDADIQYNWDIVSEDYRPFNLNVTTSEAVFNSYPKNRRMRVVVTPTNTAAPGAGGTAQIGSFNWNDDVPCWVFLTSGRDAAIATSHEVGHTFSLEHDGRTNPDEGYYYGLPNTSWAPIMGAGYYNPVVQWSKGEYKYANNIQDDLTIISSPQFGVGYRADDYGNNIATAGFLDYSVNGKINQKNGVISSEADSDFFSFITGGGNVSINASTLPVDGILHLLIKLYNSAGVEIGTYWNPDPFALNASMDVNLPAGNYFISIKGTGAGNAATGGYSAYGSLGSYSVTGTIPPGGTISPSTNAVTAYKEFNYGGFSGGLTIGDYNTERLNSLGLLNNDISSLKVAQGFRAILFQDDNFTGTSIIINSDTASLNAIWNNNVSSIRILANGVTNLDNKTFFLQNRNSGLNMAVWNGSLESGANIAQGNINEGNNQKYTFTHLGDGLYKIIANHSGESLDVENYSKENGGNVRQYPYSGDANQQFIVVATGDGFYKIIASHSGKIVDVAGASTANGANVEQWENVNQTNGQWKLIPATVTESSILIQAEDYSDMIGGVTSEVTTDVGGGLNMKNVGQGDILSYKNIYFPTTGTYLIEYRVATTQDQVVIYTDLNDHSIDFGNLFLPNTAGRQNWQTVKQTITVNAGTYKLGIKVRNESMNINWIRISKIEPETTALIQAEDYSQMRGYTTETTTDFDGGLNVVKRDSYNWLGYNGVNFPTTGAYLIEYRVATAVDGVTLYPDLVVGDYLNPVNIPNTGGWQNWQTVKQIVWVRARTYNFRIEILNTKAANINWIKISKIDDATIIPVASAIIAPQEIEEGALLYPNPVTDVLFFTKDVSGGNVSVVDSQTGNVVLSQKIDDNSLNVSSLRKGVYLIVFEKEGTKTIKRFIKK
ncbi:MAG: RICIN domain-containing protein, partial [Flavobacterium sp.]